MTAQYIRTKLLTQGQYIKKKCQSCTSCYVRISETDKHNLKFGKLQVFRLRLFY